MKNLSKVLAVVLALVMALSMVSFAAYTDVADDANYAEAVSVLSSLEMLKGYEDGTFKPEGDITRAEFAMVVCRLLGYGATAEVPASFAPFNDVAADHWASGAIALAAQQGIVNGYGDGNFGPEDNVTYEQAIKMVVAALGYTVVAEANGGYPGGFQIVAAQAGVLDGITDGKAGLPASRGVVAQLAYNALEVPMMAQTGFGDQVSYNYDNTLLLNRIGVAKVELTITGTPKTNTNLKADEIAFEMGDRKFAALKGNNEGAWVALDAEGTKMDLSAWATKTSAKATDDVIAKAAALQDYEVEAYIKDATTRNAVIVAIEKKDLGYSEIAFATEDVNTVKTDLGDDLLAIYTDETKEDYEKYDVNVGVVYVNGERFANGAKFVTIINNLQDDNAGSVAEADIRLLDSDGDEVYDIAYVTAYLDYVVTSVTARTYRVKTAGTTSPITGVITATDNTIYLDEEAEDYTFEIVKDGEVVDITAIAENDVLSIAGTFEEENGADYLKTGTVIVNTEKVSGKIDGIDKKNDIVYIDGVAYAYSSIDAALESELNDSFRSVADFYINARGIICGIDETSKVGNLKYGFVTVAMPSTGLTSSSMDIRMMDTEGTWNTYALAKDYELDGTAYYADNAAAFMAEGNEITVNGVKKYVYNTVVAYELNANGEIINIYVTANADENFASDNNTSDVAYNAATEMYGSKTLTDASIIFAVPSIPGTSEPLDEKDVVIANKDVLVDREVYAMTAFNTDDEGVAPILLGYGITGRIDWADNFMVITGKSTRTNADGVVGVLLTGVVAGEEVTLFASTETATKADVYDIKVVNGEIKIDENTVVGDASDLEEGDVVLYSVDGAGEATKFVLIQDIAGIEADLANIANFAVGNIKIGTVSVAGTVYTYYLGYVSEAKGNRISIQKDSTVAEFANRKALTVKDSSVVAELDTDHASGLKVYEGDDGSFVADSGLVDGQVDKNGDIALIKTVNDVVVVEAIVYKSTFTANN